MGSSSVDIDNRRRCSATKVFIVSSGPDVVEEMLREGGDGQKISFDVGEGYTG